MKLVRNFYVNVFIQRTNTDMLKEAMQLGIQCWVIGNFKERGEKIVQKFVEVWQHLFCPICNKNWRATNNKLPHSFSIYRISSNYSPPSISVPPSNNSPPPFRKGWKISSPSISPPLITPPFLEGLKNNSPGGDITGNTHYWVRVY